MFFFFFLRHNSYDASVDTSAHNIRARLDTSVRCRVSFAAYHVKKKDRGKLSLLAFEVNIEVSCVHK